MKKHLAIAATAATIGLAGLGAGVANAATSDSSTKTDPMSSLVDKIATKFNVNKTEVQQVFDTQKAEMQAERETKVMADIAKLVTDGKITQAQADFINAKRAELRVARESDTSTDDTATRAERKAAMDNKKSELEAWASDNGIDSTYLRYVTAAGHGHGGQQGNKDDTPPADQTTN